MSEKGTADVRGYDPEAPTLRDQFAMAALPAIISAFSAAVLTPGASITILGKRTGGKLNEAFFAAVAYDFADAMLTRREQEPGRATS